MTFTPKRLVVRIDKRSGAMVDSSSIKKTKFDCVSILFFMFEDMYPLYMKYIDRLSC